MSYFRLKFSFKKIIHGTVFEYRSVTLFHLNIFFKFNPCFLQGFAFLFIYLQRISHV